MGATLARTYLVGALLLSSVLCFVTAPFFAPDEPAQSLRALALAHGHLLPQMPGEEAGDPEDSGAVAAMDAVDDIRMQWERGNRDFHDRSYGPMSVADAARVGTMRWTGKQEFTGFGNTAVYPPLLYAPQMVGWRMGEALRLTIVGSLRLARLLTAWCAVLLGWAALRIAGGRGWMLLPLLLLPSVVFLEASCSQDALLLPSCALVAGLVVRALDGRRGLSAGELAVGGLCAGACAMARPPYLALALLLFVPAVEAGGGWRRWVRPAGALAAAAVMCGGWMAAVARFGIDTADEADPARQMGFLRAHPVSGVAAVLRGTAEGAWDFVHRGLYVVGWNDLLPHHGVAAAVSVCLAALAVCAPGVAVTRRSSRALLMAAVLLPLLGISLAEYVIWTPPGLRTVYGVMPRYWFAALPAAMLLVASVRGAGGVRGMRRGMLFAAAGGMAAAACSLPWMEAHAFYRAGVVAVLRMHSL